VDFTQWGIGIQILLEYERRMILIRADDDEEEALKHVVGMSHLLQHRTGEILYNLVQILV
jgi:hypothetical protein